MPIVVNYLEKCTMFRKWLIRLFFLGIVMLVAGFLVPENPVIPVEHATVKDWNRNSFWRHPWGKSVTHKGIDIFADWGTNVRSATPGLVIFSGSLSLGGIAVAILGPKWRVHYYAHLRKSEVSYGDWVARNELIGYVGTTGNAAGKAPHLHYSIQTLIPYPWRWDDAPQGWRKMWYLDPDEVLR